MQGQNFNSIILVAYVFYIKDGYVNHWIQFKKLKNYVTIIEQQNSIFVDDSIEPCLYDRTLKVF